MNKIYKINVNSHTKNLLKIAHFVKKNLNKQNIDTEIIDEILVAVDEAATNVIKHSYKDNPDGYIKLLLKVTKDNIVISIFHKGLIFDPNKIPKPKLSKKWNERIPGGLGIFLMERFMDDVIYTFKNSNGHKENEIRMKKHINN